MAYLSSCAAVVFALVGILHAVVVRYIYERLPEPYMDEIFHVNQTRRFCDGDFWSWNAKITTPPLLYFFAVAFGFCGRERYLNSFLAPFCVIGMIRLRRRFVPESSGKSALLTALVCLLLPVLLDTSFLFYTDLLSLTTVVWGLSCSANRPTLGAMFFLAAVLTRQTNIVWALFHCLLAWSSSFDPKKPVSSTVREIARHWAFVLLGTLFLAFFVANDRSVVLGDRSAHPTVFHAAQFLYCMAFLAGSSAPIFIWRSVFGLRQTLSTFFRRQKADVLKSLILAIVSTALALFLIRHSSSSVAPHPYLLADNRHFAFYVWRWFFQQRPTLLRYAYAPLYVLAFSHVRDAMRTTGVHKTFFFAATALTVVPAWLLEFRYFIVPFVVWRLSASSVRSSSWALGMELLQHIVVNLLSMWLFFQRPFLWAHEKEAGLQRFMW